MSPPYPFTSHTLQTPTLQIHYETSGPDEGTPLILLHGWPYSPRQYDALITHLHTHFPYTYRIFLPTLRGFSPTTYTPSAPRTGQQAALAHDLHTFITTLSIPRPILVGYDWGGRAACITAALHPNLIRGLLTCNGYTIQNIPGVRTVPTGPEQARRHWYQFYLNTEAGRNAIAQRESRAEIVRFLWRTWSPNWDFTDEELSEALGRMDSDEWVDTTASSYRHRYGEKHLQRGDVDAADTNQTLQEYERMEKLLAQQPEISVPTVVVAGAANGVEPVEGQDPKRAKFTGFYERRVLADVGHCVPAEAPGEVARGIAVLVQETSKAQPQS